MSAGHIVRHLLEEPEDDPLGIGPLDHYTRPVEFNADVRDILDHALFLKEQAEQAGALQSAMAPTSLGTAPSQRSLHRALLRIACEELDNEPQVTRMVQRLKRLMHSIWD